MCSSLKRRLLLNLKTDWPYIGVRNLRDSTTKYEILEINHWCSGDKNIFLLPRPNIYRSVCSDFIQSYWKHKYLSYGPVTYLTTDLTRCACKKWVHAFCPSPSCFPFHNFFHCWPSHEFRKVPNKFANLPFTILWKRIHHWLTFFLKPNRLTCLVLFWMACLFAKSSFWNLWRGSPNKKTLFSSI